MQVQSPVQSYNYVMKRVLRAFAEKLNEEMRTAVAKNSELEYVKKEEDPIDELNFWMNQGKNLLKIKKCQYEEHQHQPQLSALWEKSAIMVLDDWTYLTYEEQRLNRSANF